MNKYQEFHQLKKEISTKLVTIQDGDRLDGIPDDLIAEGTNKDVFYECCAMMQRAKELADEIALQEATED
ncbi:hypothetical protein [Enterococcus sp. AZ196]|uniref:hypothetical protein n=1 Tax=Enterococcus sp. AZ196 TaxID=2774659 RepID=UPI003D2D04AF